jgi:quinol monooxygenase YgiN
MRQMTLALLCVAALVSRAELSLAQAADAARYAVAYVEIEPAAAARMVAAFRQYRDASRGETGYVRFELFEQAGRPAHYSIIETWSDQGALDAHQKAASATQFRNALQSIRLSGYDERPYKPLAVATPAAGGPAALAVVSHVDIGGGGQFDAPAVLRRLAEASRMERGCLRFDVVQHTVRANHFTVIELWDSQQALDRHAAAPHTKQYRDELQPATGSPLDERVYKPVESR